MRFFPYYGVPRETVKKWRIPSETEIRGFAASIGVSMPPTNPKYLHPRLILHELSHLAVIPDFLIEKIKIYSPSLLAQTSYLPCFLDLSRQELVKLTPKFKRDISILTIGRILNKLIPDEYACQVWQAQVAVVNNWNIVTRYPDDCLLFDDNKGKINNKLKNLGINVFEKNFRNKINQIIYNPRLYKTVAFCDNTPLLSLNWKNKSRLVWTPWPSAISSN